MATKTKNTTAKKTAPKRTRRTQKQTDDALNTLAAKVRKDPTGATKAERKKVVEAGLVAAGLRGKQRQHFIETGEDSKTAAAKAPKPKAKKATNRPMAIHDAIQTALSDGAMEQKDLIEKIEALRGRPTASGTVRPYLTKDPRYVQNKSGAWTLKK